MHGEKSAVGDIKAYVAERHFLAMTIQLYHLILNIELQSDSGWGFWCWKLDPFKSPEVSSVPDVYIDLTCDNDTEYLDSSNFSLVHYEKNGFYTYSTYQASDGEVFWCMDRPAKSQRILSFKIFPEWDKIELMEDYSDTNRQLPFEVLNKLIPAVLLKHSIIQLHGVILEASAQGIIICADSGIGKTTHARLWRDYRHAFIIDGDRASCVKDQNGWTAFGIPWCGTSGEYMNRNVPLNALVVLERGIVNEVSRLTGVEAFFSLVPYLQYPVWEPRLRDKGMDLLQDLIDNVPVFRLRCRPDAEAVKTLESALQEL